MNQVVKNVIIVSLIIIKVNLILLLYTGNLIIKVRKPRVFNHQC